MFDPGALINARLESGLSVLIARKALDVVEEQGAAAISLLEDAAELQRSAARGAISAVPGPTESGGNLDATA